VGAEIHYGHLVHSTVSDRVGLALVRHSRCISCHTLEVGLASEATLHGLH
jgi:hypothetical protein